MGTTEVFLWRSVWVGSKVVEVVPRIEGSEVFVVEDGKSKSCLRLVAAQAWLANHSMRAPEQWMQMVGCGQPPLIYMHQLLE